MRQLRNGVPSDRKVTIRLDQTEAAVYWTIRWAVNAHTWSDLIRGALERLRLEAENGYSTPLTRQALYDLADKKQEPIHFEPIPESMADECIEVIDDQAELPAAELVKQIKSRRRPESAVAELVQRDKRKKAPAKLPTLPTTAPKAPANGRAKRPTRKGVKSGPK
jgi:hypothetical protein